MNDTERYALGILLASAAALAAVLLNRLTHGQNSRLRC